MKTAIYAKNLEKDVRLALYGMLEYSRVKLFPRHKNISVKLHLREHVVDGETYVDELDDRYEISVIAPGLTKEDIAIALDDRNLTVSFESDTEDGRTIGYSSFKRAWTVPEGTTEKDIEAEYTSGILSIGVQKHTPKKIPTKTITIK